MQVVVISFGFTELVKRRQHSPDAELVVDARHLLGSEPDSLSGMTGLDLLVKQEVTRIRGVHEFVNGLVGTAIGMARRAPWSPNGEKPVRLAIGSHNGTLRVVAVVEHVVRQLKDAGWTAETCHLHL